MGEKGIRTKGNWRSTITTLPQASKYPANLIETSVIGQRLRFIGLSKTKEYSLVRLHAFVLASLQTTLCKWNTTSEFIWLFWKFCPGRSSVRKIRFNTDILRDYDDPCSCRIRGLGIPDRLLVHPEFKISPPRDVPEGGTRRLKRRTKTPFLR